MDEGGCELAERIESATLDPDPAVRRAAAYVLGHRGPATSLDAAAALLNDPFPEVREAAIGAVHGIARRNQELRDAAGGYLALSLSDGWWECRRQSLYSLGSLREIPTEEIASVRSLLEDDEMPGVRIAAAYALLRCGTDGLLEERVVELIGWHSGGWHDAALSGLLDAVRDPANLRFVEQLVRSEDAHVRFRATCARARLVGEAEGTTASAAAVERVYGEENAAAEAALCRMRWEPIPRSDVLERVKASRLVLFGEMHVRDGPTRDAQLEALRAFVRDPSLEAVGYEPPAEDAQRAVLDCAQRLGLRVIPLETNWRELRSQGRSGARDLEAVAAIESFLDADPSHRMLVLRGEAHVVPSGFLVRRLKDKPLIVLSAVQLSVPLCVGGLRSAGAAFRLGEPREDVYVLPGDVDVASPDVASLERWLAAR
jgi:hypothetical protein